MDSILRLNEFFVEGGRQDLSHVLLHITEPSTAEEAERGYFFALCEVNNAEVAFIKKLQEMIDRAENEYYEIQTNEEKDPFEAVLEKLNSEAYSLERIQGDLHCIVGAIRPGEIIFSYFGNPHLLLFYKNKQNNYENMDLIRGNGEDTSAEKEEGLFSQIIQGKLSPHDYLFAGTPHLIDFFSHDRLEKIITTRSALQSAQHLEKVLSELKNGYSFGGLIINLFQPDADDATTKKTRPVTRQGASNASLQKLFRREDDTANTLSPSLFPKFHNFKEILNEQAADENSALKDELRNKQQAEIMSSHLSTRLPNLSHRLQKQNLGDRLAPTIGKIQLVLKIIGRFFLQLIVLIYAFFYNSFRVIVLLFIVTINYKNRRATIIENWRQSWRGFKENIRRLPLTTKLMLFGSIILAIGFIISIAYLRHRQNVLTANLTFNRSLQDLRDRRSSVENALIYKNDELAFAEFETARDLLKKLPCDSSERQPACAEIANQLNNLGIKLLKVLPLNATVLANLPMPASATAGLVKIKNKLVAYSPATSTLFVYDIMNGETKTIQTYPSIGGFSEAGVPKENDYVLFLYDTNKLMQLKPNDLSTKLVEISFPTKKSNLSSFVVYNRRLYTLDTQGGTIFRHDPISTGFSQGSEWLKDKNVSVSDGSDLAIDGDLFVAKANGQIARFAKGISQPFSLSGLDPALGVGARIWTYTDIPYLYILDPQNKRLIIFEKNGHLIGQLTSDTLKNPTDMVIDPTNKTVYLLDSGKLLKATLPQ